MKRELLTFALGIALIAQAWAAKNEDDDGHFARDPHPDTVETRIGS